MPTSVASDVSMSYLPDSSGLLVTTVDGHVWTVYTRLSEWKQRACRIAVRESFAKPGQRVIVVAGVPLGTPGATNMLRIAYIGADAAKN